MNNQLITLTFSIITFLFSIDCISQEITKKGKIEKIDLLKSNLQLDDQKIQLIIENDSIVNEVLLTIKDTTRIANVKRRLDSFYLGNYNTKKLILALQMERILESGNSFEFSDNLDQKKSLHFNSVEQFKKHSDSVSQNLKKNTTLKRVIDTINKKNNKLWKQ
jgi:hypothetical protein